jgi:transposase
MGLDSVHDDSEMRDNELSGHLLGLVFPWEVSELEVSVGGGRVDVWAEHPKRTRLVCPKCGTGLAVCDHAEQRAWRHLDSCAFLTCLHARPPYVECPTHGVRQVTLPWAEPMSRFSVLFERLAIDVLNTATSKVSPGCCASAGTRRGI